MQNNDINDSSDGNKNPQDVPVIADVTPSDVTTNPTHTDDVTSETQTQQDMLKTTVLSRVVEPKKPLSKVKIVLIAIGVILLMGGGAYVVYALFFASSPEVVTDTVQPKPTESPKVPDALKPASLVASIEKVMTGSVTKESDEVLYRVPGSKSWVSVRGTSGIEGITVTTTDAKVYEADLAKVKDTLQKNNVKLILENVPVANDPYYKGHFASDTIACSVSSVTETSMVNGRNVFSSYSMYASCAEIRQFADVIKESEPYIKAYESKYGSSATGANDVYLGELKKPIDSKVAGYKTNQVAMGSPTSLIGGGTALFYQTPDGLWNFFLVTQSVLGCDLYTTNDLKNAYAGEICYDDDKQSVVQPAKR